MSHKVIGIFHQPRVHVADIDIGNATETKRFTSRFYWPGRETFCKMKTIVITLIITVVMNRYVG